MEHQFLRDWSVARRRTWGVTLSATIVIDVAACALHIATTGGHAQEAVAFAVMDATISGLCVVVLVSLGVPTVVI